MRINKFIASNSILSRRSADAAILAGRVTVNGQPAGQGMDVTTTDVITLDGRPLQIKTEKTTIMFNKPVGYVVSRDGQGSRTIYDLLPQEFRQLQPVGRLDKNSSGLLLLTDDGDLANALTHPSKQKVKIYAVSLHKPLLADDLERLKRGIRLEDGLSTLDIRRWTIEDGELPNVQPLTSSVYRVAMYEGRNRQIRRTFLALFYDVKTLHRTQFGDYTLGDLQSGETRSVQ